MSDYDPAADLPTSAELAQIVARDVMSGRLALGDLFPMIPLDNMADYVVAETHQRELRRPPLDVYVERDLLNLRSRHQARELFQAEQRVGRALQRPDPVQLGAFLAEPDLPVAYRVDKLWPSGGRIVLAAKNKAGKTTLTGNLIRSLADGDPFLDTFFVQPVQRVVLIDDEMSEQQLRSWLRRQGIAKVDAVDVVLLRGRASTFDILDPQVRSEWAQAIGPADVLIFDCLRPALDALGLDESHESGRFLEALDALMAEAGIGELLLVHHMGHTDERSRGDSRLEDWPDAKWRLLRSDGAGEAGPRFFSAYGRDVDQPEAMLTFDPQTLRLGVAGGTRSAQRDADLASAVVDAVTDEPGINVNGLKACLASYPGADKKLRGVVTRLQADGVLHVEPGPNNQQKHYLRDGVDLL